MFFLPGDLHQGYLSPSKNYNEVESQKGKRGRDWVLILFLLEDSWPQVSSIWHMRGDTGKKHICKYSPQRHVYGLTLCQHNQGYTGNYQRRFRGSVSYSVRSLLQLPKHIKFEITTNVSGKLESLKIIGYEEFGPNCLSDFFRFERQLKAGRIQNITLKKFHGSKGQKEILGYFRQLSI